MSKVSIEPKILKGFRDLLPGVALLREQMIRKLQDVFCSFGFSPIDTPALEYTEILLGKGSQETDKQMYRFNDNGGRDVALRFDLTVPLARFAAMHINELGTPFKRYHIAPVWRAEKPQRGRYREFFQCDFDTIGSTSPSVDAEVLCVVHQSLCALGIRHTVRLNNRKLLNGLVQSLNATEKSPAILRAIDKLDKLGAEVVTEELKTQAELHQTQIDRIFALLELSKSNYSSSELLVELSSVLADSPLALQGVQELETIAALLDATWSESDAWRIDPSIARGLDYYTGLVFETEFSDMPNIGSIASGGRYDNLAGLYSKKELPGVGGSIGLDRILGAYEELGRISENTSTAQVLVCVLDEGTESRLAALAQHLRASGLNVELYSEASKLGTQLKYANKKSIPFAVIAGSNELAAGKLNLKDLTSGEQTDGMSDTALCAMLLEKLSSASVRA